MNMAKHGWHGTLVAFILIFPPATSISRDFAFELALSGVSAHFHPAMSMEGSIGFGGSFGYNFNDHMGLLLGVTSLGATMNYDMVGGGGHINLGIITAMVEARYLIAELGPIMHIEASASGGVAHITTAERVVSLGALGQTVIPDRSETYPAYSAGVVFSHRWDRVTFEVRPSALMISGGTFSNPQYLAAGGISYGL